MNGNASMTGVGRVGSAIAKRQGDATAAFMPYVLLGYPSRMESVAMVRTLADAGADLFEIGFPFSDPLADGPTIQAATHRALLNGMTTRECLDIAKELREAGITQPFCALSYYNPIFNYGPDRFIEDAVQAGFDGFIIPDLPPDEGEEMEEACREAGLALVYLLAPSSSRERIELVTARSTGFVYLVSVLGTTGARASLPDYLTDLVAQVRADTDTPVCVGFGVSNGAQAAQVASIADGAIVASALIDAVSGPNGANAVKCLARNLAQGTHGH